MKLLGGFFFRVLDIVNKVEAKLLLQITPNQVQCIPLNMQMCNGQLICSLGTFGLVHGHEIAFFWRFGIVNNRKRLNCFRDRNIDLGKFEKIGWLRIVVVIEMPCYWRLNYIIRVIYFEKKNNTILGMTLVLLPLLSY